MLISIKELPKNNWMGEGGQRVVLPQTKVCMHQYVGVSTKVCLKEFWCEGQQGRAVAQVGEDRKCLFTEVNTIKCVNSLYQHFSFSLGTESSQAYLGDFFFSFCFKNFNQKYFHMVKNIFSVMNITHPSFLSSLSMHQISCIHPQMKMFLWQLWDPSPYIKGPRRSLSHCALGSRKADT